MYYLHIKDKLIVAPLETRVWKEWRTGLFKKINKVQITNSSHLSNFQYLTDDTENFKRNRSRISLIYLFYKLYRKYYHLNIQSGFEICMIVHVLNFSYLVIKIQYPFKHSSPCKFGLATCQMLSGQMHLVTTVSYSTSASTQFRHQTFSTLKTTDDVINMYSRPKENPD